MIHLLISAFILWNSASPSYPSILQCNHGAVSGKRTQENYLLKRKFSPFEFRVLKAAFVTIPSLYFCEETCLGHSFWICTLCHSSSLNSTSWLLRLVSLTLRGRHRMHAIVRRQRKVGWDWGLFCRRRSLWHFAPIYALLAKNATWTCEWDNGGGDEEFTWDWVVILISNNKCLDCCLHPCTCLMLIHILRNAFGHKTYTCFDLTTSLLGQYI